MTIHLPFFLFLPTAAKLVVLCFRTESFQLSEQMLGLREGSTWASAVADGTPMAPAVAALFTEHARTTWNAALADTDRRVLEILARDELKQMFSGYIMSFLWDSEVEEFVSQAKTHGITATAFFRVVMASVYRLASCSAEERDAAETMLRQDTARWRQQISKMKDRDGHLIVITAAAEVPAPGDSGPEFRRGERSGNPRSWASRARSAQKIACNAPYLGTGMRLCDD